MDKMYYWEVANGCRKATSMPVIIGTLVSDVETECNCDEMSDDTPYHACPYAQKMGYSTSCVCCEFCTERCAME